MNSTRERGLMDAHAVQQRLVERFNLRVDEQTTLYLLRRLHAAQNPLAVMGGDARTGCPVQMQIPPDLLTPDQAVNPVSQP